jgi:hypothetical protein
MYCGTCCSLTVVIKYFSFSTERVYFLFSSIFSFHAFYSSNFSVSYVSLFMPVLLIATAEQVGLYSLCAPNLDRDTDCPNRIFVIYNQSL